ncbi:hypothetical protein BaRGS_00008704 [Batillaria attramentaria]|uniref:Uncharacterized protein n=1 Tax=Batillaria attramentaria TaxID=370345 RepID=A0ABD0LMD4_9CAEN
MTIDYQTRQPLMRDVNRILFPKSAVGTRSTVTSHGNVNTGTPARVLKMTLATWTSNDFLRSPISMEVPYQQFGGASSEIGGAPLLQVSNLLEFSPVFEAPGVFGGRNLMSEEKSLMLFAFVGLKQKFHKTDLEQQS